MGIQSCIYCSIISVCSINLHITQKARDRDKLVDSLKMLKRVINKFVVCFSVHPLYYRTALTFAIIDTALRLCWSVRQLDYDKVTPVGTVGGLLIEGPVLDI